MILDTGICSVFQITNTAAAGSMPNESLTLLAQHWFGELSFESSPVQLTETLEQVEISKRIRILQNRSIREKAIVMIGTEQYQTVRLYHGFDKESGEQISDLNLSRVVAAYDVG